MKILIAHNRYRERTGEDAVFDREVELLKSNGHDVTSWTVDNRDIKTEGFLRKFQLVKSTVWSQASYGDFLKRILGLQPDIVHVHNTLPILSPAVFHACSKAQIPVVHTLHNYRLACPSTSFFLSGEICEKCISSSLVHSIKHACYRDSRMQTAAVAAMLMYHRWKGTWGNKIDGYIALSEFQKSKLSHLGIAREKIYVKPNFIGGDFERLNAPKFGTYYLFVGRLIDEKGIQLLIDGYQRAETSYPLFILGPGYLKDKVVEASQMNSKIRYVGTQSKSDVLKWMKNAIALLFPSVWYECSPMTILEAYSCSLPVISTDFGAIPDMVQHRATGYIFSPAIPQELSDAIHWTEANPQRWIEIKRQLPEKIRPTFFEKENYKRLIEIYRAVTSKYTPYGNKEMSLRQALATNPN